MHDGPSSTTLRGTPSRRGRPPRILFDNPNHADAATLSNSLSSNRATTLTSSLSIPVEGATRIVTSDSNANHVSGSTQHAPINESRRAPRKSKTDALAALHTHARSSSIGPDDFNHGDANDHSDFPRPIAVTPRLDLSTVKTSSPRSVRLKAKNRPFDLEDCPVFYPTTEEFKDPMSYIRSISDKAKMYGLCKVVPPAEWTMPFVADTETFRFKTRLQQLNSIEASSRAKVNFLEQLYRFHKQQGNLRIAVPSINHKPLDLWLLRKEVQRLGGYEVVTKNKKWSDLGRILGYGGIPGLSTQIKNSYTRVILPYEHFSDRVKNSSSLSSMTRDTRVPSAAVKSSRLKGSVNNTDDASPPSSPLSATSSPLSEPPDDSEYTEPNGNRSLGSKQRRVTRTGSQDQGPRKFSVSDVITGTMAISSPIFHDGKDDNESTEVSNNGPLSSLSDGQQASRTQQNCEICHKKNRGDAMLLCDGCDCGFHIFCLDPPLTAIPKGQWFCHTCLCGTGGDFGFDEGEEHSLSSFQARDREFRRTWFESHPPSSDERDPDDQMVNRIGNLLVSEYDVENEFWRLVQSQHETVEVEYGADVHSTTHGSAMPTMETHPLDPYSKDLWNLNNIPIVSDSLLRFIKSDISGMTVPWTYVGMVFSTFCWHNEDHYTYSINFMHWGETKTWYGIPGEDADKFEAAIKCEAPDLFEAQPDLLFQLVTLMNPKRVTEAGVRVYACNQRAGEFVITFPKAYHAGFNHGFNFNEAVNFALPDWLPYGRDCAQRYREHRKSPVFSHDELLITITQQSQSVKTAMWLIDSLNEMTQREMQDRKKAREMALWETLERVDRPEEQYQCIICKSFCYLSQVTCQCTNKVVCVDHADLLCDRGRYHLILRKRLSDEEIFETQAKVAERAAVPSAWRAKLNKLLSESPRPQLRSLRAVLAEGDRINYPLPELAFLRKCVNRANEWIDTANAFLIRKQSRKRSRKPRGRPPLHESSTIAIDELGDKADRGLGDLHGLLHEVENLGFDCPEIEILRTLASQSENTQIKARTLLDSATTERDRDLYIQECERLLLEGSSLNVNLDELFEVEKIVMREQLIKELEEKLEEDDSMTLEEVRQLLSRARACSLPPENIHLQLLKDMQEAGDQWEERARKILAQPYKTIDELLQFSDINPDIPSDPALQDRLTAALTKAKEFEKQAKFWLTPESEGIKPKVQEVLRLVARAEKEFSIPAVHDLKRTADIAMDLETRCEQVLSNRYQHRPEVGEESDVFSNMRKWRSYARDHLKMFTLPAFERLDRQLSIHYRWLEGLPWYCPEHQEAHGQQILEDVIDSTRPDEDLPPADQYFTCICTAAVRPPPAGTISDAVQCDHCFARFHGICAANGGSCPFCDHHHWNGAIHKERSWHSCFLSPMLASAPEITQNYSQDWKQLEIIVHRIDRLSAVIGQFLSYASVPGNQRLEYISQVRHYMRKLYKIQFAVSPHREVSFGLDLAGLHRILAGQPAPVRMKKRRRPRFTFGQDVDNDWLDGTRCICRGRTAHLLKHPTVQCEVCARFYHAACVFFPPENLSGPSYRFSCPLCCLRKNRTYQYSHVRVKPMEDGHEPYTYVDIKEMLNTFSKEIIFERLGPPYTQTLFVELVRFTPGQPDSAAVNGGVHPRTGSNASHRKPAPGVDTSHSRSTHAGHAPSPPAVSTLDVARPASDVGHHVPPPPPWSRWGTMSTPSRPPSTQRRQPTETPRGTPQPPKKRKHVEDSRTNEDNANGMLSSSRSPKRRTLPPQPSTPPSRPVQTLSPSLAMIVCPPEDEASSRPSSSSFGASTSIPISSGSMSRRVELSVQGK